MLGTDKKQDYNKMQYLLKKMFKKLNKKGNLETTDCLFLLTNNSKNYPPP